MSGGGGAPAGDTGDHRRARARAAVEDENTTAGPEDTAIAASRVEDPADAIVLGKRGRPRKGEEKTSNRKIKGGTNIAYTLARLDRDRPDLAERVRAGRLSANAAAVAAGCRGRQNDPLIVLRRAWARATPEQRTAFLEEVGGPLRRANEKGDRR